MGWSQADEPAGRACPGGDVALPSSRAGSPSFWPGSASRRPLEHPIPPPPPPRPRAPRGRRARPRRGPARPIIAGEGDPRLSPREAPKGPDTPVPFWHEVYRCVTMPEHMDFDLDPGTYDVYMAFDLLNRDGGWVHRSIGYLTDIRVEAARRTRLDGMINLARGADRQVELQSAAIEPEATASPAPPGP